MHDNVFQITLPPFSLFTNFLFHFLLRLRLLRLHGYTHGWIDGMLRGGFFTPYTLPYLTRYNTYMKDGQEHRICT